MNTFRITRQPNCRAHGESKEYAAGENLFVHQSVSFLFLIGRCPVIPMCFLPFCGAASRVSCVRGSERRGAGCPRLSLVLPVHALAVRRAEFLPAVVFVGDKDNAAAAGAGEDPEDGSLSYFVRRAARLFPVSLAAARFGAEALRSPVRGEGPAAAGAYGLYVHRMPRSAGKKTRKKGRVKSSLRMVNPGPMEVPRYTVTVKDAAAGAKLRSLPPPVCGLCADSVLLRGRLLYGRSS